MVFEVAPAPADGRTCHRCAVPAPSTAQWCGNCGAYLADAPPADAPSDAVDTARTPDQAASAPPASLQAPPRTSGRTSARVTAGVLLVLVVSVVGGLLFGPEGPEGPEGAVTVYGDGDIGCPSHVASDTALPVGTVVFQPEAAGEVRVVVTLADAAADWEYDVELWSDESCLSGVPLSAFGVPRLTTDADGAGELRHVFTELAPGTYRLNVNLSSRAGVPPDARHREMGASVFTEVVVDG